MTTVPTLAAAALALVVMLALPASSRAQSRASEADRALAREIFRELIEIDTSVPPQGDPRRASEVMAARLRAAGFPAEDASMRRSITGTTWCVPSREGGEP